MQALNINVHKLPVKKKKSKHNSSKKGNPHNSKQRSGNSKPDYKWNCR